MEQLRPQPLSPSDEADVLAVVRRIADLVGVPFELSSARAAFEQACSASSTMPGWAVPMHEAASSVGVRLRPWSGSARDAWARSRGDLPMVTAIVGPDGASTWVVVGGRTILGAAVWEPVAGEDMLRMSWRAFARRLGEGDPEAPRSWLLAEPVAPAVDLLGAPGEGLGAFARLWALLRSERQDLGVVLVYAAGIGVLGLATPVVVQVLVNTVAFGALLVPILVLSFILFLALAFAAVLRGFKRHVVELLQRRVFVRMVADLAWRLPRVKVSAFDKQHGPELLNRFFDVLTVQKAASSILVDGVSAAMQAIVGLILLAVYHPVLLGFDLFLLIAIVGLLVGLGRRGPATAIRESKVKYQMAGWLEEVAAHPGLFKLSGGSQLSEQRADEIAHSYLDAREAHFVVFFRQYMGTLFLQVVAASGLLGLGGWLVVERQLSLGQLVAAELVVASVLAAYAKFADKLETFYDLLAGLDKLGTLVDLPLEDQRGTSLPPSASPLAVAVDGASFAFPDGGNVFDDLDLDLEPGAKVGVLGGDGSGKSVLADLLVGLRPPTGGRVRMDGLDVRELRPDSVRRYTALCRGEEVVSGSLAENVRLGRPDHSRTDILEALGAVGLAHTVDGLPMGLDTPLAPNGAPLSHTQVMRLMLARAIVGSPRLLVVDQTLDALAPSTRGLVFEVLLAPDAPWTLVVLTQDPFVLDALPRRYRLHRGRLVGDGTARAVEVR